MQLLNDVAGILISFWLWHFTWGWTQGIMNVFLTWVFLKVVSGVRFLHAGFLAVASHICVTLVYTLFVVGLLVYLLDYQFGDVDSYMVVYGQRQLISLSFAFVYGILQYGFFVVVRRVYQVPLAGVLVVVVLSNTISALIAPLLIRLS